jgi:predicted GNAT family acetyltransferase
MEIKHDINGRKVFTVQDGRKAEVEYELKDGTLDIIHTYVPEPLEGRGIASQLVQYTYDYALQQKLKLAATCSYAKGWLKKHPDYQ